MQGISCHSQPQPSRATARFKILARSAEHGYILCSAPQVRLYFSLGGVRYLFTPLAGPIESFSSTLRLVAERLLANRSCGIFLTARSTLVIHNGLPKEARPPPQSQRRVAARHQSTSLRLVNRANLSDRASPWRIDEIPSRVRQRSDGHRERHPEAGRRITLARIQWQVVLEAVSFIHICYRGCPVQARLTLLPAHVRFKHRKVLHLQSGARQRPATPLRCVRPFRSHQMAKAFQTSSSPDWKQQPRQSRAQQGAALALVPCHRDCPWQSARPLP